MNFEDIHHFIRGDMLYIYPLSEYRCIFYIACAWFVGWSFDTKINDVIISKYLTAAYIHESINFKLQIYL